MDSLPKTVATILLCDHGQVDARALHADLGVGTDFSTWVRYRISECHLVEGKDYEIVRVPRGDRCRGGHNRLDYMLSLCAARQIAMSENSDLGRVVRKYICENFVRS